MLIWIGAEDRCFTLQKISLSCTGLVIDLLLLINQAIKWVDNMCCFSLCISFLFPILLYVIFFLHVSF
jgi:hypothetical protein